MAAPIVAGQRRGDCGRDWPQGLHGRDMQAPNSAGIGRLHELGNSLSYALAVLSLRGSPAVSSVGVDSCTVARWVRLPGNQDHSPTNTTRAGTSMARSTKV